MAQSYNLVNDCSLNGDIIHFLEKSFKISLTNQDLINPVSYIMAPIFERFLLDFGCESVVKPDLAAIQGIQNIERFEKFISLNNLFKSLSYLLENVGYEGLSFNDIFYPRKERNLVILSHLILIWNRYSDFKNEFSSIESQYQSRQSKVINQIKRLEKTHDERCFKLISLKHPLNPVIELVSVSVSNFEILKSKSNRLQEDCNSLKIQLSKLNQKLRRQDKQILALKDEVTKLEIGLVCSPKKLFDLTEQKENLLEERRRKRYELARKLPMISKKGIESNQIGKELGCTLEVLQNILEQMDYLKMSCSRLDHVKFNQIKIRRKLEELKLIHEQKKDIIIYYRSCINKKKFYHKKRINKTKDELEKAKGDMINSNEQFKLDCQEMVEEESRINEKIDQLNHEKEEIEKVLLNFLKIRNQLIVNQSNPHFFL